jgi:prefoldin subunit 5
MKKTIAFFFLTVLFIVSCSDPKQTEEHAIDPYKQRFDSLSSVLNARDSTVNELLKSFNQVEQTLDSVAKRQNIISLHVDRHAGELRSDSKKRISLQIEAINALMEKNKNQISVLNQKLKRSGSRISEFQNIIITLNDQITQKNTELEALNERLKALNAQLASLQVSVDTLSSANYEQSELIAAQTNSLRTAYYVVGNSKELAKMNVINKDGGLLGLGKTSKLSPEFDPGHFTRVDYTQVLSIPVYSKKAKIVTTHPAGSYELDKDKDNKFTTLRILQPEKFWSASKFLVIITG